MGYKNERRNEQMQQMMEVVEAMNLKAAGIMYHLYYG